jgi:hypothetical protein
METSMPKVRWPIVIFLIMAFYSCAAPQVSLDYDSSVDFSRYKTFAWLKESQEKSGGTWIDNPLIVERVRAAVEKTLASKGYKKLSGDSADFYVVYHLSMGKMFDVQPVRGHIGIGGIGITSRGATEKEEGLLLIKVNDAKTGETVWRGLTPCRVKEQLTPEQTAETVNKAVEKILAQFPPQ